MPKAVCCLLLASLAAVTACSRSPSSCVGTKDLSQRLGDAQYHLHALDVLLKTRRPDHQKVREEETLLVEALVDAADGIRAGAPVEATGYQDAAQPFRANHEPVAVLRSAVRSLRATLDDLNQRLYEAQQSHGCNAS